MCADDALRLASEERFFENLVAEAARIVVKRAVVTVEKIREITDAAMADSHTKADIARRFGVSQCAVGKYKAHFQRTSTYFEPARRGPKPQVEEATRVPAPGQTTLDRFMKRQREE